MEKIRLPKFTAKASLYRGGNHYQITRHCHRRDMTISPALVDNECYNLCYNNCLQKCFNLPGWDKRMCVADCRQISRECREACTVTPPPPSSPPQSPCPPGSTWTGGPPNCPTCTRCDGDICEMTQPLCSV